MAAWKPPPPPSRRRHLDAVIAGLCPDCTRIVERGLKQQRFLDATPIPKGPPMNYPVIVETLTRKIVDGSGSSLYAGPQHHPSPFHVSRTCTEMNKRARLLGIKTRYEVVWAVATAMPPASSVAGSVSPKSVVSATTESPGSGHVPRLRPRRPAH